MEIREEEAKTYLYFLEKYKHVVGLEKYKIALKPEYVEMESYATVESDIYDRQLTITLSTSFKKFSEEKKCNVLFHELVHARISVYNEHTNEFVKVEEEHLANDLVQGFEEFLDFKLE